MYGESRWFLMLSAPSSIMFPEYQKTWSDQKYAKDDFGLVVSDINNLTMESLLMLANNWYLIKALIEFQIQQVSIKIIDTSSITIYKYIHIYIFIYIIYM